MVKTLLCAALLSLSPASAQGAWKLMHDPLHAVPYPQATAAEQTLITKAGRLAGFRGSQRDETKGQMLLEARMPGPFLLRGAQETALLYGDGDQEIALMVLRGGKPVLHLQLMKEPGMAGLREAYALKDIDGDGLRELALSQSYEDGGASQWLTYLNFAGVASGGLPRLSGVFHTGQVDCEIAVVNGKEVVLGKTRFYRLWVLPGKTPQFKADELGTNTCGPETPKLLRRDLHPCGQMSPTFRNSNP